MKICVYGAGNVGLATAAYLTQTGQDVILTGRNLEAKNSKISVTYTDDLTNKLRLSSDMIEVPVTSDLEKGMKEADLVLLSVSSKAHDQIGNNFSKYLKKKDTNNILSRKIRFHLSFIWSFR